MQLPSRPHRFAQFFRDIPILDDGQPLQLLEQQRNRAGFFLEAAGFGKVRESAIKWWPPPRGHQQIGNAGIWVPADTPDPPEVKLPDPEIMTAPERQWMREQLAKYDDGQEGHDG